MTPKRSRRGEASSSQARVARRDERRTMLASRTFSHGRPVDREAQDTYATLTHFTNIGWSCFLNLSGPLYKEHIIEFYSGLEYDRENEVITLQMYDKLHQLSLDQFCAILGLPREGNMVFSNDNSFSSLGEDILGQRREILSTILKEGIDPDTHVTQLKDTNLKEEARFWNKILLANVIPRGGNMDRLIPLQCYILFCLKREIKIDVGFIVINKMLGVEQRNRNLPFGYILSKLFEHLHLPVVTLDKPPVPLTAATLHRMRIQRAAEDQPEAQPDVHPSSPPHAVGLGSVEYQQLLSRFHSLEARLQSRWEADDALHTEMQSWSLQQTSSERAWQSSQSKYAEAWSHWESVRNEELQWRDEQRVFHAEQRAQWDHTATWRGEVRRHWEQERHRQDGSSGS